MTAQKRRPVIRAVLAAAAGLALFAAMIFWPAGTLDWVSGWCYLSLLVAYLVVATVVLERVNPELIEHRMRMGKGTKRWDKIWAAVFAPIFLGIYVVAGLDAVRYGWSAMSPWWWLPGSALFIAGAALLTWSMAVNPFFEKTVRIQKERGHYVIDTGPYRFVRHPGYVGFMGWCLSAPLLLGSWWAFLPAVLAVMGIVTRTALEDRTLQIELDGYADFAGRVRYRLIPGIW